MRNATAPAPGARSARLHPRHGPARVIRLVPPPRRARVYTDGVRAGLVGTMTIIGWWLVADAVHGHPLDTPGAVAAAVFHHGSRPVAAALGVDLVAVAWAHLLAFLLVGIVASRLLALAERRSHLGFGVLLLLVLGSGAYLVGVAIAGQLLLPSRVLPTFVFGNVLATIAVALVLHRQRPVRIRP
jgi:hypothetical protein